MKKLMTIVIVVAIVGIVAGMDRMKACGRSVRTVVTDAMDARLPIEEKFKIAHEELANKHEVIDSAEYDLAKLEDQIEMRKKQFASTKGQSKTLSKSVGYGKELLLERRDEYNIGGMEYSFGEFAALVKNEGALLARTKAKLQSMDAAIVNMEAAYKNTQQAISGARTETHIQQVELENLETTFEIEELQGDIYGVATSVLGLNKGESFGDKCMEDVKRATFMQKKENARMAEQLGASRTASISRILPDEMSDEEINAIGEL